MPNTLTDNATIAVTKAIAPLSRSTLAGRLAETGIRNEARTRALAELWLRPAEKLTGIERKSSRWHRTERAAVADLTSVHPGAARPKVAWHEGGSGPVLLLINGWTASGLLWPAAWLADLESRYRVVRIDNRGTGWSRTAPAPFTIADLARDAYQVLQACGVNRAAVVGLSMGGMIAQEFAIRYPEVVDELILCGTRPPTPEHILPDLARMTSLLGSPSSGEDLPAFLTEIWGPMTGPGFPEAHPEVIEELVEQIAARVTPRAGMIAQARALWSWHGAHRLARIKAPTTVIHGDRDPLMPVGNGMRLARLIPGARYVELPGVGHLVPQEAGAVITAALRVPTA
ncbi:MAG: alpha/beta hydrolase [Gordonia sp. (in: high G+C Gram-positive bacteria)]